MKTIDALLILLCFIQGIIADVHSLNEINKSGTIFVFGIKAGYQFKQGFLLAPEITLGYLNGTSSKTDPFVGITFGYRKIFSRVRDETDIYSDLCLGAVTDPLFIYGLSFGIQKAFRYGSRPLLHTGNSINRIEKKFSIYGGWLTTTDITISGENENKSVAIAQKVALPLPPIWYGN
jgi:hypothetical protein